MTKRTYRIAFLYSLFAVSSIVINIGSQMISIAVYAGPFAIELSILVGTIVGLPLRYYLEKIYIFNFSSKNLSHDGQLFLLYSFMGLITTTVFWVTEYAFYLIFDSDMMRYVGGVIGLVIGFFAKYQLDKKYVFIKGSGRVLS
jgi:putative flippase GtrA